MATHGSSARPAAPAAQTVVAPPTAAEKDRDREARRQAHWERWAADADKERSYAVVFDKQAGTSAAATDAVHRMLGRPPKLSPVKRLPDLTDTATDLGQVQISMVSAEIFVALREQFHCTRISVMLPGNHKRTAFIPGAAKDGAGASRNVAAAAPAAAGAKQQGKNSQQ
ncbi:uncharacterized protein B0T15DRAFT_528286 [Chaetomium strumarium]|uniref:Uncharacterized protein n=1 Tax=Chaetomium strumarium TaxID=1170767 RepID=A0AAJ0M2Y3_9PEZI|nr:hypothetical protein B0T15DRAFT_528286 [Chaetomium strumarium]